MGSSQSRHEDVAKYCDMVALRPFRLSGPTLAWIRAIVVRGRFWYLEA